MSTHHGMIALGDGYYVDYFVGSDSYYLLTPFPACPRCALNHPDSFRSQNEWGDYLEKMKEYYDGQYRKASTQGNSGAAQITNQSAGRPGQVATGPAPGAITSAVIPTASQGPTAQQMIAQMLAAQQQTNVIMGGLGSTYQNQLALGLAMTAASVGSSPPHAKTDLKTSDMVVGEIIAYRVWYIDRLRLKSATADVYWDADKPMVGDPASGYGIHAYKDRTACFRDNYACNDSSQPYVFGEVALWGDVIEHEDGYRAEFARPHRFLVWHPRVSINDQHSISTIYLCEKQDKAA